MVEKARGKQRFCFNALSNFCPRNRCCDWTRFKSNTALQCFSGNCIYRSYKNFSRKKWTMELTTLKRWSFGLSGFYLILALIFGFFTVNQIPTEIYSNVRIFLVVLTLSVQLLLLGLSGIVLFNKLRKSIGNFAWGFTVVLLSILGAYFSMFYKLTSMRSLLPAFIACPNRHGNCIDYGKHLYWSF